MTKLPVSPKSHDQHATSSWEIWKWENPFIAKQIRAHYGRIFEITYIFRIKTRLQENVVFSEMH